MIDVHKEFTRTELKLMRRAIRTGYIAIPNYDFPGVKEARTAVKSLIEKGYMEFYKTTGTREQWYKPTDKAEGIPGLDIQEMI